MPYCHRCERSFHRLGIMRHCAMHRDKKENCTISYSKGTFNYIFTEDQEPSKGEQLCLKT